MIAAASLPSILVFFFSVWQIEALNILESRGLGGGGEGWSHFQQNKFCLLTYTYSREREKLLPVPSSSTFGQLENLEAKPKLNLSFIPALPPVFTRYCSKSWDLVDLRMSTSSQTRFRSLRRRHWMCFAAKSWPKQRRHCKDDFKKWKNMAMIGNKAN